MTVWDLVRTALRRWPIVAAGAVVTLVAVYGTTLDDGVYWSRAQVVFLAPASTDNPNMLRTTSEDVIITAGVVAKAVVGPAAMTKYASPDVTLIGEGVRDGWSLRLPDTGGQWATHFNQQVLYVEVVAATPQEVEDRQTVLVDLIAGELRSLQEDAGVAPVNNITVTVAPESSVIHHVQGSPIRSAGMVGVLGVGATCAVLILAEARGRRPVTHDHPAAPRPRQGGPHSPVSGPRTDR